MCIRDRVFRGAGILVAAVGRPEMITGEMVKPGATVIDVGINRIERDGKAKLVGDVDYASAAAVAGAITPVSYTHLRAHETVLDLVCRLLLEKKKNQHTD